MAHLVELGHERIGLISMTDVNRPGREVPAAWRRGGARAGLDFGPELNVALPASMPPRAPARSTACWRPT